MRASPIALWIGRSSPPSRGCCRDGAGDPRVPLVGRPCPTSSSSSSSGSPERTGAGAVSASRASFEALEIPRTKRRRPTLNAFSAIEVLVPYTSWRSTRISASFRPSDRPNSTSQPDSRFMIKYSRRADTKAHPPAPAEAQSVRSRYRSPLSGAAQARSSISNGPEVTDVENNDGCHRVRARPVVPLGPPGIRGTAASCAGTVGWIVVIASVPIQHFVLSARPATALSCFTLGAYPNAPGVRRPVIPPRMPRSPTLTPRAPPVISSSWMASIAMIAGHLSLVAMPFEL